MGQLSFVACRTVRSHRHASCLNAWYINPKSGERLVGFSGFIYRIHMITASKYSHFLGYDAIPCLHGILGLRETIVSPFTAASSRHAVAGLAGGVRPIGIDTHEAPAPIAQDSAEQALDRNVFPGRPESRFRQ